MQIFIVLETVDDLVTTTSRTKRPDTKKRGKVSLTFDSREDLSLYSPILTDMETKMNANEKLQHDFTNEQQIDTCITACGKCGKRVLNFGLNIHNHEYHSGEITKDVDSDVVDRMAEIAAL